MAWAAIKRDIRARLGEPNQGYWTDRELQDWYNEAVALQHRAIWQGILQIEDRSFTEAYENDYCRAFIVKSGSANLVPGTQDYAVPSGFWRAVRVTIGTPECPCDYSPYADDWEVRYLPHKAPSPTRPKYTLTPDGLIRFYVVPGLATVPNSGLNYWVYFAKQPNVVDLEAGGVIDTNVSDPFNTAPKAWVCYRAMVKQFDDGGPYQQEFLQEIRAITPAPSKETSEKKTIIIREAAATQGQG